MLDMMETVGKLHRETNVNNYCFIISPACMATHSKVKKIYLEKMDNMVCMEVELD